MAVKAGKRKLTDTQLEATHQRRETIRRLATMIKSMSERDRLAMASKAGIVTCEGRPLSVFNTCMVINQQPDATVVGGFQQWQRAGRQVKKGSHGCTIFVPKIKSQDQEEGSEDDRQYFFLVTVFDITMTEESEKRV